LNHSLFFDSAHLSLQAARSGYGVAMGDTHTVAVDLKEGRLVRLFATAVPAAHPYYLVSPPQERMKPTIEALEFWIIDRFSLFEQIIGITQQEDDIAHVLA
jgi:DNA-binding transcriptional LysR family regulator